MTDVVKDEHIVFSSPRAFLVNMTNQITLADKEAQIVLDTRDFEGAQELLAENAERIKSLPTKVLQITQQTGIALNPKKLDQLEKMAESADIYLKKNDLFGLGGLLIPKEKDPDGLNILEILVKELPDD